MSAESVPPAALVEAKTSRSAIIPVVVLCFGGLCAALTQTLVIPIQGELPRLLDTSAANASWVVTATLLTGAVTMPVAGRLGDMFGKQRVLVVSAVLLLLGSLVCGGRLAGADACRAGALGSSPAQLAVPEPLREIELPVR